MWEEAIELVHQRDLEIQRYSDEFARHKGSLRNGKRSLDALDLKLYNTVEKNVSTFYFSTVYHSFKHLDAIIPFQHYLYKSINYLQFLDESFDSKQNPIRSICIYPWVNSITNWELT